MEKTMWLADRQSQYFTNRPCFSSHEYNAYTYVHTHTHTHIQQLYLCEASGAYIVYMLYVLWTSKEKKMDGPLWISLFFFSFLLFWLVPYAMRQKHQSASFYTAACGPSINDQTLNPSYNSALLRRTFFPYHFIFSFVRANVNVCGSVWCLASVVYVCQWYSIDSELRV